jgi:hypothetical protein
MPSWFLRAETALTNPDLILDAQPGHKAASCVANQPSYVHPSHLAVL